MSNWRMIKVSFRGKEDAIDSIIKLREDFKETGYDENHDYWIGTLLSFNGVSDDELETGMFAFHTKGCITSLSNVEEIKETGVLDMKMELPWEIENTLVFLAEKYNIEYVINA